jgi:hypothetical protein
LPSGALSRFLRSLMVRLSLSLFAVECLSSARRAIGCSRRLMCFSGFTLFVRLAISLLTIDSSAIDTYTPQRSDQDTHPHGIRHWFQRRNVRLAKAAACPVKRRCKTLSISAARIFAGTPLLSVLIPFPIGRAGIYCSQPVTWRRRTECRTVDGDERGASSLRLGTQVPNPVRS